MTRLIVVLSIRIIIAQALRSAQFPPFQWRGIIQKQGQTERDERERERVRERGQQRHHRTTVTLRIIKTNLMQLGTTS